MSGPPAGAAALFGWTVQATRPRERCPNGLPKLQKVSFTLLTYGYDFDQIQSHLSGVWGGCHYSKKPEHYNGGAGVDRVANGPGWGQLWLVKREREQGSGIRMWPR